MSWQPTSSNNSLKARACLLHEIRAFFAKRQIMEVQTPLLCTHTVSDLHINSFSINHSKPQRYLQTSPEYAMKRLLAAGSGPIYQICKAFRQEESGRQHNPEFSLLEWYRPDFDHHRLMQEVSGLIQALLNTPTAEKISYADIFLQQLNLNPHTVSLEALHSEVSHHKLYDQPEQLDHTTCLELLMSHCIEPTLGINAPTFIFDYPKEQAALAKLSTSAPTVAQRFELYIHGKEIANGFNELNNQALQQERFMQDNQKRTTAGLHEIPLDKNFLNCLNHLPNCAGVALGIDRLLMIKLNKKQIKEVISFSWEHC